MAADTDRPPTVFLSYSRDSPEHADRVLALADRLRGDGFDAALDQYEVSPPEGWPLWRERQVKQDDFVLLVCTARYGRITGGEEEAEADRGARYEADLIRNLLYQGGGAGLSRLLPVLPAGSEAADIPLPVRGADFYQVDTADGYGELLRRLMGQAAAPRPPLGPRPRATDFFQPWNVPHARNPFFTGRDEALAALRAAFVAGGTGGPPRVLSGLGGVGKTQTAVEYAYLHRQDYQAVLWAQADSAVTLTAEYARIAALLDLPEAGAQDLDKTRAAVTRWLGCREGYLLVLDNADDPAALKPFLPPSPAGHILLTSRVHDFAILHIGSPLDLPVLPPGEAAAFLLRRTEREAADPTERAAASALAEELGSLPLALEQAGAYLTVHQSRFADYLASYRRRALDLLERQGPQAGDYEKTVAATWSLNFEAVQSASEASAELLRFSAFLAPDRIPEEVLVTGGRDLGGPLAAALAGSGEDRLLLDELLEAPARYSLIRRDIEARTYDIHRLVQAVLRHGMDEAARRDHADRVVWAVGRVSPDADFAHWPLCDRLLPHQRVGADTITRDGIVTVGAARLLGQAGSYLQARAQYAEAERLLAQALAVRRRLGPEQPETATSLNSLASLYQAQGRYGDAAPMYEEAIRIWKAALGPNHPDTATGLSNLASLCQARGDPALAVPLYAEALRIWQAALGPDDSKTATCLNNLGDLYREQGDYAQAEPLLTQARDIRSRVLGPDDPATAQSLNNLALLYEAQGNPAQARPLYERALRIRKKALGPDHPDTAQSLNNLALLLGAQGDHAQAERLLKQAVRIWKGASGPEHPETATGLSNLASLYEAQGDNARAAPLYAQALAIFEKALGPAESHHHRQPLLSGDVLLQAGQVCRRRTPGKAPAGGLGKDAGTGRSQDRAAPTELRPAAPSDEPAERRPQSASRSPLGGTRRSPGERGSCKERRITLFPGLKVLLG